MSTLRKEVTLAAAPQDVWEAVRDFGAVSQRLTPGVVTSSTLEADERIVTFATGVIVREVLVSADDDARRLVYGMISSPMNFRHYNAAIEVRTGNLGGSVLVWTVDLLPDELTQRVEDVMDMGAAAMQGVLGAPQPSGS